jgi:hypothetical protein
LDIALNSSHKDQWMRMFVFVIFCQTEAAGGSQDHLVLYFFKKMLEVWQNKL